MPATRERFEETREASMSLFAGVADDDGARLAFAVEAMRELSTRADPGAMTRAYAARMRRVLPTDRLVFLDRRGLRPPAYRVVPSSTRLEGAGPCRGEGAPVVLEGGLLGELLDGDEPRVVDHLEVAAGDPGAGYLAGQCSLLAVPLYDGGVAAEMVVAMRRGPAAFRRAQLPELVWLANLFGNATRNAALSAEVGRAYGLVERDLKAMAGIQRALLPEDLPRIPTLALAARYRSCRWAGGDYYDVLPLPGGSWGLLIADVSGHGPPAAVLMAVTHALVHAHGGPPTDPGALLGFVNRHLAGRAMAAHEAFVTAFYGVYDPAERTLAYASAGHNPPRLWRQRDGAVVSLEGARSLPLGITAGEVYSGHALKLDPGDRLVLYTDGVTEAADDAGRLFGTGRLDDLLARHRGAPSDLIDALCEAVDRFTAGQPIGDDRTILVADVHTPRVCGG